MRSTGGAIASGNPCMSESDAKANEGEAGAPIHDASLRVDPRTLSSEEQDFARLMGFGEDPQTPGQEAPPRKAAARPRAPARDAAPASEDTLPPAEAAGPSDPPARRSTTPPFASIPARSPRRSRTSPA